MIAAYSPLVVQILKGITDIPTTKFSLYLPVFYPLFTDLVLSDSKEVRIALKGIFMRVGKLTHNFKELALKNFTLRGSNQ